MEGSPASAAGLGRALYELGWRQGALFLASTMGPTYFAVRDGSLRMVEAASHLACYFVSVTQDCDLVAKKETLVEALQCRAAEGYRIRSNNWREFVVQQEPELIAEAARRVLLEKAALAELTPLGRVADERAFARWLARRFDRPAVPDSIVECFQSPANDVMRRFFKRNASEARLFNEVVREIRVNLPSSIDPPYALHLIFLLEGRISADQLHAVEAVRDEVLECFGPDDPKVALDREIRFLSDEEMTIAEYFASVPLWLDDLTYRGDEVAGSTPFGTG